MKRVAKGIVVAAVLAGGSAVYSLAHAGAAPAVHMYHHESSITVVHTGAGYRVVRAASQQTTR